MNNPETSRAVDEAVGVVVNVAVWRAIVENVDVVLWRAEDETLHSAVWKNTVGAKQSDPTHPALGDFLHEVFPDVTLEVECTT